MFKRALNLFFAILIAITAGSVMTYPVYSYYIKTKFNFSLREINLYATFINIGVWVAFGMGIVYDSLGPKISNAITLLLLPGGFLMLYRMIRSSSVSLFWFLLVALIMGQGSALAYTNSLSTSVKSFSKKNSSNVVGLIISNCAIAPSIFTSVKILFFSDSIDDFIVFVVCYGAIIIALCLFWFDVVEGKKRDDLNEKLFHEFKQKFIIYIFSYANFVSLVIFIIISFINHIFGIEIPAFIVFFLVHIVYIVFVILERNGEYDNWLIQRFERTHRNNIVITNNNFDIGGRSVEVMVNNNNVNNNNNKSDNKKEEVINSIYQRKNDKDKDNDDNKGYSESEHIGKIKDKYDFGFSKNKDKNVDNKNKNDHSLNINISKSMLRNSLEKDQNINNIAENNQEANGRISLESNSKINEEKKEEEKKDIIEKEENKDEEEKEENKNEEEEKENDKDKDNNVDINKENNVNNNKEENDENSNLEKSINKINSLQIKEDDNNNIKDNNDNNNEESIDNGAKEKNINDENNTVNDKKDNENSKIEEKTEKIDDTTVNYPKFSINSSNNNKEEAPSVQNNYPKFSISSEKKDEENPYKEKDDKEEEPKFSIANKENEKEEEQIEENNNINNIRDNDLKNNKEKKQENINQDKNQDKIRNNVNIKNNNNKTNINTNKEDFNYIVLNTNTLFNVDKENNNNNKNITTNTNTSFMPINNINNSQSIFSLDDEKEDDNSENYTRCVFLLTLFRRPQIMLLFVVLALTMGCMISNVNNIKYIVASIDHEKSISSTSLDKYPLLYFAFNSLSRVVVGGICNELMGTYETFTILKAITVIGLISQVFGFFMTRFFVYLSISFAGMTHGGLMTFVPLYCRYYFSLKNLGTVLGFLTTGNALGSLIIATLIFPAFYHKYSTVDKYGEEICSTKKCFRASYGINCLFVLFALIISNFIYKEDKGKKIKERREKENIYRNITLSNSNIRDN